MDHSNANQRIFELEKENQDLKNQITLLQSELKHKTSILNQTNSELEESQTQYKQLLSKMVEMNQNLSSSDDYDSGEVKALRLEIREQQKVISILENQLSHAEKKNFDIKSSMKFTANYKTFEEMRSLEKKNRKLQKINNEIAQDNQSLAAELHQWSNFSARIYYLLSDSLHHFPDFPINDQSAQRRIIISLEKELIKISSSYVERHISDQKLLNQSQKACTMITDLQNRCSRLSHLIGHRSTHIKDTDETMYKRVKGEILKPENIVKKNYSNDNQLIRDCENEIDFFSHFGNKVERLSKVTKQLKNDYYELKRLQEESMNSSD